jgi:hypothetical protein
LTVSNFAFLAGILYIVSWHLGELKLFAYDIVNLRESRNIKCFLTIPGYLACSKRKKEKKKKKTELQEILAGILAHSSCFLLTPPPFR